MVVFPLVVYEYSYTGFRKPLSSGEGCMYKYLRVMCVGVWGWILWEGTIRPHRRVGGKPVRLYAIIIPLRT